MALVWSKCSGEVWCSPCSAFIIFVFKCEIEICVKNISQGLYDLGFSKVCTNIGSDLLHCIRKNQHLPIYPFLYLSIFCLFHKSLSLISYLFHLLSEPEVFKLFYTPLQWWHMLCKRKPNADYNFWPSLPCNANGNLHLQSWFNKTWQYLRSYCF